VVEGLVERQRRRGMTTVEFSVEVDAPAETVWEIASDPCNLPQWDKHIERVEPPEGGMQIGATYDVVMALVGVHATVHATVLEWEPPWRSCVRLEGLLEATVTTSVASLPFDRSLLRHEVSYRFRGPFGRFGAAGLNAMGGAGYALKHGVLAQKREIEERARA
jgi:ligand-binding SRPBCC domain-containing protein